MKRRIPAILTAFFMLITIAACSNEDGKTDESAQPTAETSGGISSEDVSGPVPAGTGASPSDETQIPEVSVDTTALPAENGNGPEDELTSGPEFSMKLGEQTLTIRQHGAENVLNQIPFEFVSDYTEKLGPDSDTFNGSFIRTVTYNGFEVDLFAPKDDPENFWVMRMTATSDKAITYRGIKVGDAVNTMMDKYPEAEQVDEGYYVLTGTSEDAFNELSFIVVDGIVEQITLTFYLP